MQGVTVLCDSLVPAALACPLWPSCGSVTERYPDKQGKSQLTQAHGDERGAQNWAPTFFVLSRGGGLLDDIPVPGQSYGPCRQALLVMVSLGPVALSKDSFLR